MNWTEIKAQAAKVEFANFLILPEHTDARDQDIALGVLDMVASIMHGDPVHLYLKDCGIITKERWEKLKGEITHA